MNLFSLDLSGKVERKKSSADYTKLFEAVRKQFGVDLLVLRKAIKDMTLDEIEMFCEERLTKAHKKIKEEYKSRLDKLDISELYDAKKMRMFLDKCGFLTRSQLRMLKDMEKNEE